METLSRIGGLRVGILGGTFDPVHYGHLAIAARVKESFGLDKILFIPAAEPPHKQGERITPFADRLAMLNLAVSGSPDFMVSEMEAGRSGPSYSIDTLRQMRKEFPAAELFFIIGSDAFAEIASWKNYFDLPELANFILIARASFDHAGFDALISNPFPSYVFDKRADCWWNPGRLGRIWVINMQPISISSTEIRDRVRQRDALIGLLPATVADYIETQQLYLK